MISFLTKQKLCLMAAVLLVFGTTFSESAPWVYELNRLDNKLEKKFSKQFKLRMGGSGGGGVQGFYLYSPQFYRYAPTTKEESRLLLLTLVEDVLHEVNNNSVLKEGMISYPFTPGNLRLDIFFRKPDGNFVDEDEIGIVSIQKDRIQYSLEDDKIAPLRFINEPLREALEKIEGSRQKFPFIWECVEKLEAK